MKALRPLPIRSVKAEANAAIHAHLAALQAGDAELAAVTADRFRAASGKLAAAGEHAMRAALRARRIVRRPKDGRGT